MFASRSLSRRRAATFRPGLESLENRFCPASPSVSLMPPMTNASGGVTLTGMVMDENPAGLTIQFSGQISGSAVTDSTGYFSLTSTPLGSGTISAQTTDGEGLASNIATTTYNPLPPLPPFPPLLPPPPPLNMAPTISLTVMPSGGSSAWISGFVMDEAPGGLTVQLTGMYVGTAVTNSMGGFSLLATPSGLGLIQAQTTDSAGLSSNVASAYYVNLAPVISSFFAMCTTGSTWTFTGMVQDECSAGLQVQFGGLPSLEGKTATVQAGGYFTLTVELQEGEQGTATALVADLWGQLSATAMVLVL